LYKIILTHVPRDVAGYEWESDNALSLYNTVALLPGSSATAWLTQKNMAHF